MEIKDLQPRQGNVDITIEVVDKGDIREFQKFGKAGRVCSATAKDGSGEVKLTLWNEQIDQVNAGDKVQITNGYVNEFQGEKQLTTGRAGKLEVIGKGEAKEEKEEVVEPSPKKEQEEKVEDLSEEPIGDEEEIK